MKHRSLFLGLMVCMTIPVFLYGQNSQLIRIHLKSFTLEFIEHDSVRFVFSIRNGRKTRSTPAGEGYIYEKRGHPVFRYVDPGPKKGMIVDTAECAAGKVRVQYKNMRALGLHYTSMTPGQRIVRRLHLLENGEERYSIHSVTCDETIGMAISKGCVGMRVPDLLALFPYVIAGERGTRFVITDD